MLIKNKRLFVILSVVAFLLILPLAAMQFTSQVNWSAADFLVAAALLLGAGLVCEWVMRSTAKTKYRIILIAAVLLVLLLVWLELAVGIFGTPFAGS